MRDLGYLWQSYQLEALLSRNWNYKMRVWINDVLYDSHNVYSDFKKDFKMFSDGFTIGSCPSGYFEFTARDQNAYIPKNSEVRFEIKISGERGDTEWFPFGTYFIDNRAHGKSTITFQCYDRMLLAEQGFWDAYIKVTKDTSAKALRPEMKMSRAVDIICEALGTTLDPRSQIFNDTTIKIEADYTCREVLKAIAISNAGNFLMTDEDKLRLLVLANDSGGSIESRNDFLVLTMSDSPQVLAVNPSNFSGDENGYLEIVGIKDGLSSLEYPIKASAFEYYDSVQLQNLVMVFEEGSSATDEEDEEEGVNYYLSGKEDGVPSLEVTNVFATQQICDSVFEKIKGFEYRGFNANTVIMDPAIEIGDPVVLSNTFINVINCSWYGALASDLESPLSGNTTSEFPYKTSEARTFSRVVKAIKNVEVKLEVTSDSIIASVEDLTDSTNEKFAELTLTATGLSALISQETSSRIEGDRALENNLTLTAEGLQANITAEATARTGEVTRLETQISATAAGISSFVQKQSDLKNAITISNLSEATDTDKTYKIQSFNAEGKVIGETYYYYNTLSKAWEKISGDTVYTMFTQTDEGFVLKGNTVIDGTATITRNLVLSGNVTWDMSNSPVKTQYSTDGVSSWHDVQTSADMYMRMSFDGGTTWSTPTKVVGTDGQDGADGRDGYDGSDAYVTAQNVFDALTSGGTAQGLFPAFYDGGDKLFINATYIKTGQLSADRIDTENLSCTRLYAKNNYSGYSARLNGNFGDFGIFNSSATDSAYSNDTTCLFGIYNSVPNVNFYVYGHNFMGVDVTDDTVWAKGTWDFSVADVIGISGGSGGTTVAVFG